MPVVLCLLYYMYWIVIRVSYKILVISHLINPMLVTLCLLCCIYYTHSVIVIHVLCFLYCVFSHCACYTVLLILRFVTLYL